MHLEHLGAIGKPVPMQSLGAPGPQITVPCESYAPPSLHHQHNLGRGACLESKPSLGSLHGKSFKAQRQAESCPTTIGTAPAKTSRSFAEKTLPKHLAFGEQTSKLTKHDPPSPQLCHVVTQLRAEVRNLQSVVRQLVELQSVASHKAKDNTELGENKVHNNNVQQQQQQQQRAQQQQEQQ